MRGLDEEVVFSWAVCIRKIRKFNTFQYGQSEGGFHCSSSFNFLVYFFAVSTFRLWSFLFILPVIVFTSVSFHLLCFYTTFYYLEYFNEYYCRNYQKICNHLRRSLRQIDQSYYIIPTGRSSFHIINNISDKRIDRSRNYV